MATAMVACAWGKDIRIVVIPTEATIKVNGSYYGYNPQNEKLSF